MLHLCNISNFLVQLINFFIESSKCIQKQAVNNIVCVNCAIERERKKCELFLKGK